MPWHIAAQAPADQGGAAVPCSPAAGAAAHAPATKLGVQAEVAGLVQECQPRGVRHALHRHELPIKVVSPLV